MPDEIIKEFECATKNECRYGFFVTFKIINIGREWCEWDSRHENKPVSLTEALNRALFFLMLYTVMITNMYY